MRWKRGRGSGLFYTLPAIVVGVAWMAKTIAETIGVLLSAMLDPVRHVIDVAPWLQSNQWLWLLAAGGLTAMVVVWFIIARKEQNSAVSVEVQLDGNIVTYRTVLSHEANGVVTPDMDRPESDRQVGGEVRSNAVISAEDAVSSINHSIQTPIGITRRRYIEISYRLDTENTRAFSRVGAAFEELFRAERVWLVTSQTPQWDYKRNAGASTTVQRSRALIGNVVPSFLGLDLTAYSIRDKTKYAVFLPDRILGFEARHCCAISYGQLQVSPYFLANRRRFDSAIGNSREFQANRGGFSSPGELEQ